MSERSRSEDQEIMGFRVHPSDFTNYEGNQVAKDSKDHDSTNLEHIFGER